MRPQRYVLIRDAVRKMRFLDKKRIYEVAKAVEGNVVRYKWQDGVNLAHAIWIFGSPWWMHFASRTARWDHWVVAVITGVVAAVSLPRSKVWKEAVIIAAGGWLFLSPWLLGFAHALNARWNAWMLGALLIYVASWALTDLVRLSHRPLR